jgi:protein-S-isoprenylcysteine O-methyltransferase Ste14
MNDIRRRGLSLSERVAHLRDALGIGLEATSGAEAELKTDGLYRWSRNPQYFVDIGILIGWANLSASSNSGGIATGGVVAFALAPAA